MGYQESYLWESKWKNYIETRRREKERTSAKGWKWKAIANEEVESNKKLIISLQFPHFICFFVNKVSSVPPQFGLFFLLQGLCFMLVALLANEEKKRNHRVFWVLQRTTKDKVKVFEEKQFPGILG